MVKNFTFLIFLFSFFCLHAQTPFYLEDFSDGIPTGWSSEDLQNNGGEWTWCDDPVNGSGGGCPDNYQVFSPQPGEFDASTASNGFLVMDSDGLNVFHFVELTSSPFNFSDKNEVWVSFESLIGVHNNPTLGNVSFQVSNDLNTWISFDLYDIVPGVIDLGFTRWSYNPERTFLDISEIAANQSQVYFKWSWQGNFEYYWLIDDLKIYDENPCLLFKEANDMRVNNNWFCVATNAITPVSQIEAFGFLADIENIGCNDQTNVNLNMIIKEVSSLDTIYHETLNYETIGVDSLAQNVLFDSIGFVPNSIPAKYEAMYIVDSDSLDSYSMNNIQSFSFEISDSIFAKDLGPTGGIRPNDSEWSSSETHSWRFGNCYHIVNGNNIRARHISFSIANTVDLAGQYLTIHLYKWVDANSDSDAQFSERTEVALTTYEILGTEGNDYIQVELLSAISSNPEIYLEDNTDYIAVVDFAAPNANTDMYMSISEIDYGAMIYRTATLGQPRYAGFLSVGNETNFNSLGFGHDVHPVIRLHISPASVATSNITNTLGKFNIYPNPSKHIIRLDVDLVDTIDNLNLTITDQQGKQIIHEIHHYIKKSNFSFDVSKFPSGNYFIKIGTEKELKVLPFIVMD